MLRWIYGEMPASSTSSDRTTPVLRTRIREVFRHLPKALAGAEEPIHQMRVAGRRLRVALPHLARRPNGKRVQRALTELRRLTRGAGASRDLDVMLGLFEERLRNTRARTAEQTILLRRLRGARARSRGRMADALLDLEIARLRRDLRTVLARKGERLFAVLLRLGQTQGAEGGALLATFETLGARFDPDALHRLRIRARRLRYAAELHTELTRRRTAAPEILKELQEQLGEIRDQYLVAAWLDAQARTAIERGQPALAEEARRLESHFLQASRARHRTLLERDPVARLGEALRAMGQQRPAA
jgi:CHAD domain-containing protein